MGFSLKQIKKTKQMDQPIECADLGIVKDYSLTKREYMSVMALQGVLSNPSINMSNGFIVRRAIQIADELIEQLKTK